jgi:hypothetical protein
MNDERTLAQLETGLFGRGVLEFDRRLSDRVAPVGAIRQIDKLGGDLRRNPQDVLRSSATGLNPPSELSGESLGNLVQVRAKLPTEEFARSWIVVYAADNAANHAPLMEAM